MDILQQQARDALYRECNLMENWLDIRQSTPVQEKANNEDTMLPREGGEGSIIGECP
jgi:hypothetical protein